MRSERGPWSKIRDSPKNISVPDFSLESETSSMEPASPQLTLTLFGAFEARCSGAAIPDLQKRDGERLLALLALQHGRPVKTEALAQTLWAASGSLDSLHQAASHLRRSLG